MVEPGTNIAERYRIIRQIGKGGMGKVYEARHTSIGKRVAIKILNKEYSEDKEALERFQQEARIAGAIGHINICEVLDLGTTEEGQPFLVMEFLEGDSVSDILEERKSLPINIALAITKQVLDALEEVHSRGIVHRDLKPENIILNKVRGHGMVVKLLDFGISKVMRARTDSLRLTKTGTMLGTPYYMSPEQVRGNKDIEYSTDIYSCGVILYEMICGQVPFGGTNYNDVILSIVEDSFPDPKKLLPGLSGDIVNILKCSMEKNSLKRFESATVFKQAITKLPIEIGDGKNIEISGTQMSSMTDTTITARQIRHSGLKTAFMIGAAIFLVVVIIGLLVLFTSEGGKKGATGNVDAPKKVLKAAAPLPNLSVSAPERIKVTLENAPEGVRLAYGDRVIENIEGGAVEIDKSADHMILTISAEGFAEKKVDIVPDRDLTLDGKLEPAAAKWVKPEKDEKPLKSKKKKKKMKPIWNYD